MDKFSKTKLNNSVEIPWLGFGLWDLSPGLETQKAVNWALEAGYRHFDNATIYNNELDVGKVINNTTIPRKEFFITSKVWNDDQGYESTIRAFNTSMKKLALKYLDLYLIHWPASVKRKETWKALETLYEEGKCRAIGVSNYSIKHIEELLGYAKIIPAVNQVEFNLYLYQKDLLDFCNLHNIQLEAWSPLVKGMKNNDPKLVSIAKAYSKTPAQILLKWCLQHKVLVIPKSARKERIIENSEIFEFNISDEDMKRLDLFDEKNRMGIDPEIYK
jgi:diketogulonate reductase-like aldo/keto reductase